MTISTEANKEEITTATTSEPSQEAIASIITQAQPTTLLKSSSSASNKPPHETSDIHTVEPSLLGPEASHHTTSLTADQTSVELQPTTDQPEAANLIPLVDPSNADDTHATKITAEPLTLTPKMEFDQPKTAVTTQSPTSQLPSAVTGPSTPPIVASQPRTMTRQIHRQTKTPTRNKLFRFLLPCFHPTLDDHHTLKPIKARAPPTSLIQVQDPSASNEMVESTRQNRQQSTQTQSTSNHSRRSPIEMARQHLKKSSAKQSNFSKSSSSRTIPLRTVSSHQLLPTPVSDTVTPAGAAAATSAANAHGSGGVQVPIDETEGVLSGAVVPPGKDTMAIRKSVSALRLKAHSNVDGATHNQEKTEDEQRGNHHQVDQNVYRDVDDSDDGDEEDRIVAMGGMGIPIGDDGLPCPLLAPLDPNLRGRKCLVLDLDETLVHSSFKVIPQSDFVVPVEIENAVHNVHVIKRPGVDEFMRRMGEIYEVVVFTASLSKYADPVLDMLDVHKVVKHRLFRESCYNHKGNFVKDLSQLGRPINETIIIDNSPASYVFHPNNAVPVSSWFNDPHDTELTDLASFLTDIANVPDVTGILDPTL